MKKLILLVAALLYVAGPAQAQEPGYEFSVEHLHTLKNRPGQLILSEHGIEYRTSDPKETKDARTWLYGDLWQIKIASPTRLEVVTYEDQHRLAGRDRIFIFRLLDQEITPEISAFLMKKTKRPMVTSILPPTNESPVFTVSVKHLHLLGGCEGVLKIFGDRLTYESPNQPHNSRLWRFSDIQDFSHPTRYAFSLTSYEDQFGGPERTYSFQLKEDMPPQVADYLWERVYPMKYPSKAKPLKPESRNAPTAVPEKNN